MCLRLSYSCPDIRGPIPKMPFYLGLGILTLLYSSHKTQLSGLRLYLAYAFPQELDYEGIKSEHPTQV